MMSPGLFILTITLYLVCAVASLIGSFFSRHIPSRLINIFLALHGALFLGWLILKNEHHTVSLPGISNYLFISFFCTGLLVAGVILRKKYSLFLKIYSVLFLLTLAVFIVSPSRVLGFIASGNINAISSQRYHLVDNYYFVEQQSVKTELEDSLMPFKIVREMGFFHKTITRDVLLPASMDSVTTIDFKENENIFVRIYYSKNNRTDSLDKLVPMKIQRDSSTILTKKQPPKSS